MGHYFRLWASVCVASLALLSAAEEQQQKRLPSGFTGVRGKKSIPESSYSESNENAENNDVVGVSFVDKRAPSGFLGMRGKKPFDGWISQEYADVFKRAPSGFMGMRGKKDMYIGDDYDKRVPSGFFGMRGKKPYNLFSLNDFDEDSYMDKRAPSGFFGMRGKKGYNSAQDVAESKRVASENRFFGMRGKKQPSGRMGFFGMRGKKFPFDPRGKFVGVRGKKSLSDVNSGDFATNDVYDQQPLRYYGDGLDIDQLMSVLAENVRNEIGYQDEKSDGYLTRQME